MGENYKSWGGAGFLESIHVLFGYSELRSFMYLVNHDSLLLSYWHMSMLTDS